MASIPRDPAPDATLALLREGYDFVGNRCRRLGSDVFRTRILLQPIVCMSGAEAAERFYGDGRFTRRRAIPRPTLTLLQDFGSVQGLDGEAHRHRKALFLELLRPEALGRIVELSAAEWEAAPERWARDGEVALDDAVRDLLGRAACAWVGVPLPEHDVRRRSADLAAMFDGAGGAGPRQVRGQRARRRGERWIQGIVEDVRAGRLRVPEDRPLHAVLAHEGLDGRRLTDEVATVELINLLRPTVAVARFVTFAAVCLHDHPEWRERLRAGDDGEVERFVQEVRRVSPFFPAITGRVAEPFEWRGHAFGTGDWVLLDLYGTNRDPRSWEDPEAFDPDRFRDWDGDPFRLIPQGGGDHATGHRCPGEWLTIELMKVAVRAMTRTIAYEVPEQDLAMPRWRMPTVPRSRFHIRDVRRVSA